jgi:hypothetical protein
MSEHALSSQLMSQQPGVMNTSVDSEGVTIDAIGLTQAAEFADSKPRCTDFAVSHYEVRSLPLLWSISTELSRCFVMQWL